MFRSSFTTYRLRTLFSLLVLLVAGLIWVLPRPALAANVATCDEAELTAAIIATPAGGTVTFDCSGTITLATTPTTGIVINKNLTIDGTGQTVTISGGNTRRIFLINAGVTLNLNNLTLSDGSVTGRSGGAILNNGTATVTNTSFSDNSATNRGGAISNNGTATISNSSFSGNSGNEGGAISSNANSTTTVTNTSFSNNSAQYGGAIFNNTTTTVSTSTFSGNSASVKGGAIYNTRTTNVSNASFSGNSAQAGGAINNDSGTTNVNTSSFSSNSGIDGGAINNDSGTTNVNTSSFSSNSATGYGGAILNFYDGTITIRNSSFSSNSATNDGGAIFNAERTTVSNSTFSGNSATGYGGAIYNRGTTTVGNSSFSGNSATNGGAISNIRTTTVSGSILANSPSGDNCASVSSPITDGGYNLDNASTCGFTQPTSFTNTDPLLDTLADNGGPTLTFALLPGSPALDQIPAANCFVATDQRGLPRPAGVGCDIGAFEVQPIVVVPPVVVPPVVKSKPLAVNQSDLIPQFRLTPDRESSIDQSTEIAFSFKVKNVGQGTATGLRIELPIDPSLAVGYGSFDDSRVWVTAVTSDKVIVSLPSLAYNQEVSGKVIFRPSDSVTPGTKLSLKYVLRFDDPTGIGKTLISNGQSFTFADSSRDVSGGAVQLLTPDLVTAKVGDSLEVVGDFYLADEIVSAWYTGSAGQGVALGTVRADANGKVSLRLVTQNLAAGSYSVVLYGNRSEVSGSTILDLQ